MSLNPYQPEPAVSAAAGRALKTQFAQPDSRVGTIYDRAERRRPHDRRQRDDAVYLDLRACRSERRKTYRRSVYDPGRRNWPEPPLGVDVWV